MNQRPDYLSQNSDPQNLVARVRSLADRVRQLERAPWPKVPPITPVAKKEKVTTIPFLYVFDWRVGANQPQSGVDAAVLKYVDGAWALAEQPVNFFLFGPARATIMTEHATQPLMSVNDVIEMGDSGIANWTKIYSDTGTAYVFHTRDASGRLWRATVPISASVNITISRSDIGDGSDWVDIDIIGDFYQILGMAAHPTDSNVVAILASDNNTTRPSLIITTDGASFSSFALPVTGGYDSTGFDPGGLVTFRSDGRIIVVYQYRDSTALIRHVAAAYSDSDPTIVGNYILVDVLDTFNNDDANFYRILANRTDDKLFVMTIREKLGNYRPALRIGVSVDGAATWTEIDNNGFEAPDAGLYDFDDYLFQPGGIRYITTDETLHIFGYPDAEEPDDHGASGYELIANPVDLAWVATTPLGTPSWSSQKVAIVALTGHDQPAFAYDAVSHA